MAKPVRWQYRHAMKLAWMLVVVAAACTRPNPAVCCLDQADCNEVGISEVRECSAGLACVEHQCVVPSCAMTGCEVAAPVCNLTTDVCEGCTDSSECSRFPDATVCDTSSGGCVECVAASDCPAEKPVCDSTACRACTLDTDCASDACGDDGACVGEDAIIYLDPGGSDSGTCTRVAPCRSVAYAISQTANARNHLVFAAGGYEGSTNITTQETSASRLYFHGHGAHLYELSGESATLGMAVSATLRDLEITGPGGTSLGGEALNLAIGSFVIERLVAHGGTAFDIQGAASLRDVRIDNAYRGILLTSGSQLTLDRAIINTSYRGIEVNESSVVEISNTLVYGTSNLGINLVGANGTVTSSTIVDCGTDSGTGPRAFACGNFVTVRSSIIWAPGSVSRVPISGCNMLDTIAGPTATPGAMNVDPGFVDPVNHDYHLAPNSAAVDAVDSGPATDFDGDARPQGARYDIGADEAAP